MQESIWGLTCRFVSGFLSAMCPPWWLALIIVLCLVIGCSFFLHYQYNNLKMVTQRQTWRTVLFFSGIFMNCTTTFAVTLGVCASCFGKLLKYGLAIIVSSAYVLYLFPKAIFRNIFYAPEEIVTQDQPETYLSPSFIQTVCENNLLPVTHKYAQAFLAERKKKKMLSDN
jgi:hypothetical protein